MKSVRNDVSETLAVWSEEKWNSFGGSGEPVSIAAEQDTYSN